MSAPTGAPWRLLWVLSDDAGFAPDADLLTTELILRTAGRDPRFEQRATTLGRIATRDGAVCAWSIPAAAPMIDQVPIDFAQAAPEPVAGFDAVFVRADPPIDELFRHALIQLARVEREAGVWFVNSPSAVLSRGSKLFNLEFAPHLAPGLVAADPRRLADYARAAGGAWIVKPLDRASGTGVCRLDAGDRQLEATLARLSQRYGFLHLQRYLPAVEHSGEIRHLVFDGRLLAAWRKQPAAGDYRANLDQGARAEALPPDHDLGPATALAAEVGRREPGFVFYSLDTIDGHLNELNVENTGGLPNADQLYGAGHAERILDLLADGLARRDTGADARALPGAAE